MNNGLRFDSSIKRAIFCETIQFLCFALFVWLLYRLESMVIKEMSPRIFEVSYLAITGTLQEHQLLSGFGHIWLMAWPFFIVSVSLIIFKKRRWLFLSVSGFLTALYLTSDRLSFEYFSNITTISSFKAASQLWSIKDSVNDVLTFKDLANVLVFFIFVPFGFCFNKYVDLDLKKNSHMFFFDKIMGIVFFFISTYSFNLAFFFEKKFVVLQQEKDNEYKLSYYDNEIEMKKDELTKGPFFTVPYESSILDYAACFGIMNFHIKEIASAINVKMTQKKFKLNDSDKTFILKWFKSRQELNEIKSPFWAQAKGRNIILVTMESLHPIVIGKKIDGEEITPTINSLLKGSLYWPYIIHQGLQGGTSDSEFSVMSGLLAASDKVSAFEIPSKISFDGLGKILKESGYQTLSFHGNTSGFWNRNVNHPIYGIDKMFFQEKFGNAAKLGMGVADKDFFIRSSEFLSKEKSPFFAYLITLSAHNPYNKIPSDYLKYFKITGGEESVLNYLRLIKYTDYSLGLFIESLKEKGLWDNSILVVFGDHTPPMRPDSQKYMNSLFGINIESVSEYRVPLLITIPGKESLIKELGKKYTCNMGGLNDLYPTILHLAGIAPVSSISGLNFFLPPLQREPIPILPSNNRFWIYNGIVYHWPSGAAFNFSGDDNSIIPDKQTKDKMYQKTQIENKIYKLIYLNGHGLGVKSR